MTGHLDPGASSHWARIEESGVYAGLRIMLGAYRLFGRRVFSLLLYPVVGYFFLMNAAARQSSRAFLARVYGDPRGKSTLGSEPGWRHSYRHFRAFGEAILDKLAAWSGGIGADDVEYENREIFDALRHAGRGGLLVASHLGNMEVCRALGELSVGLKLNVLVHTKHAPNFNRLLQRVSPESSVSLIQTTEVGPGTAMMLAERVRRGEFVVIVGDRVPVSDSSHVGQAPFFGKPAAFPHGPYILASLLECPVLLLFCFKEERRFRLIFEAFEEQVTLPRRDRNARLDGLAARFADRLETYCSRYPYQWFNFFDFWGQAGTIGASPPERI